MSNQTAGYSGTPLVKKLGIKTRFSIALFNEPDQYLELLGELPEKVTVRETTPASPVDFIHMFTKEADGLSERLVQLRRCLVPNGMIWVSWPKKASNVPSDVTEDVVRNAALEANLVDVKVCAVDDVWSALKLVIRRIDR